MQPRCSERIDTLCFCRAWLSRLRRRVSTFRRLNEAYCCRRSPALFLCLSDIKNKRKDGGSSDTEWVDKAIKPAFGENLLLLDGGMRIQALSSSPYLLSDSSAILRANISASSIFCSMSRRSSWLRMAVNLMRCISVSASAAFWASSLASSSAICAFSANRSAVCSDRS